MTHTKKYSREQVVEQFAEYEATHPVEEYRFYDWHAWPMLRLAVGGYLVGLTSPPVKRPPWRRFAARCARTVRPYWPQIREHQPSSFSPGERSEVALLTPSNRSEMIGGVLWHPVADPIAAKLRENGISVQVWERGPIRRPRRQEPIWIQEQLNIAATNAQRRRPVTCDRAARTWLRELANWATVVLDRTIPYDHLPLQAAAIQYKSHLYERWFEQLGCRCFLVDTWYGPPSFPALIAARRLGIPSIDIQHGVQGPHHYAYSGWTRQPENGFEIVPDASWLWGNHPVHYGDHRPMRAVTVGNLWINLWRQRTERAIEEEITQARRLTEGYNRTILVTTQPIVDMLPFYDAIAYSPRDWRWLVRIHRATDADGRTAILEQLGRLDHPGVEVDRACRLPLYALMQVADVHMTGFSTCALEALAFRTPTIIVHPSGQTAFGEFINDRLMGYAETGKDIISAVERMTSLDDGELRTISNELFQDEPDASEACLELVRQMLAPQSATV